ncbi:hypothetical protein Tsubulata_024394 [Turnera subulata]|uniref:Uncharacterized protein n=1 Tax=Turnera subulata TaxID=218843 RepID=A0A9Q0J1Q4_9ROSI|nr:hypothetical protein Tsubulata_024394 [Turnera subulata]
MEAVDMDIIDSSQQLPAADTLTFARSYQLEALEKALKQNTIVYLETGSGKTLIAIMLLRSYAYLLRKPSRYIAVFLVPQVVLVRQQAEAIQMHTDLEVGMYWGDMGVDYWNADVWKQEMDKHEVLVMTPQILLSGLRHSFFKLHLIKVLIVDECHHATGKHPYACIMTEFYHRQLTSGYYDLPRIFGMTASPIKSKGANLESTSWKVISELEHMMYSKVYTCASESVLAAYIPFSTARFKFYKRSEGLPAVYANLADKLKNLKAKHKCSLKQLELGDSATKSISNKLSKIHSSLTYCLDEFGVWLASKAAEFFSDDERKFFSDNESDFLSSEENFLPWGKLDVFGKKIVQRFSLDASVEFANFIPTGSEWSLCHDTSSNISAGLLTTKVACLIQTLLEYRDLENIRCIVFVERVITAIVLQDLLNELLPRHCSWSSKYIAGNNSGLQLQTRKIQNEIVEEFREGKVNVIVATSILEEGLDVQSCNLVIRFDPSATVSSFIQSRGRARMQDSHYLLMVESGDFSTLSRLENYLSSGDVMRKECLRHASQPCLHRQSELNDDEFYYVEGTGAIATLSSSVCLIYFYCSRLPSDGYFKPAPRFIIDEEIETCTLLLPKSCPLQTICVQGNVKSIKQVACLEACKRLHRIGALTDHLVPDIVVEESVAEDVGNESFADEKPIYFPTELVNQGQRSADTKYHCYLIELKPEFDYEISVHDIVLVVNTELESEILSMNMSLEADRGSLTVNIKYIGHISLGEKLVDLCRLFQITLFKVLMKRSMDKLVEAMNGLQLPNGTEIDYYLLPCARKLQKPSIDWITVNSVLFSYENVWKDHVNCSLKGNARAVQTKNGLVCTCVLQNSLVYTPHNGNIYCITGILENLNGNSSMRLRNGGMTTYKQYYQERHGIKLCSEHEPFLDGRHIFPVQNCLHRCRQQKEKESQNARVQLPPELCSVLMSPISISTFYSFVFVPSIMHRLESLLIAVNLKKIHLEHCMDNVVIPAYKVLEAITTKKCQEKFHLESLETLGDSFLKYAASQQLFKTYQTNHEGLLSLKKDKIVSNVALCKLGCERKLPGFIRDESFDPKNWIIPGDNSRSCSLFEEFLSNGRKIYATGTRRLKRKTVADVVEALIGAYLSTGGEGAALLFMRWIGIKVDFVNIQCERELQVVHPEKFVNIRYLESLLNYKFKDPSLLVEALTHGSFMVPELPRCYQRLEFLGDAALDYLITVYLYNKYPGMSPGLLTDMRSASVNNDCYALSAVRRGLHKHILHTSQELQKHISLTVKNFEDKSEQTFGWECETSFPKVLGDVIESLAGAILVDSGYNKQVVFQSMRPLLEPLITPETVKLHPVRELNELCQKQHFDRRKTVFSRTNNIASATVEVDVNGTIFRHTSSTGDRKTAEKLASKEVLKALKENLGKRN